VPLAHEAELHAALTFFTLPTIGRCMTMRVQPDFGMKMRLRKERERRQINIDQAQNALDAARRRHDQEAAGIQAKIEDLEKQSRAEEARGGEERSKLEAALRRARG
jgi:hypothetical protein